MKKREIAKIGLLAIVLSVFLSAAVIPAMADTGKILIKTDPKNDVKIYVDGEYLKDTFSGYYFESDFGWTSVGVSAGTHTLKLTKAGYKDWIKEITVGAGESIKVRAILESAPITTPTPTPTPIVAKIGQIKITSSPEGANLYIDSEYYGETKSYSPEPIGLKAGTHTIKLTKEGYKNHTETITVKGGYIHKMTIILESSPVTPPPTETPITPTSTPAPTEPAQTPVITPTEPTQTPTTPAFVAVIVIAGLVAVAYLIRRRKG